MSTEHQSSTTSEIERTGYQLLAVVDRFKGGAASAAEVRKAAVEHAENLLPWLLEFSIYEDSETSDLMTRAQGDELIRLLTKIDQRGARMMGEDQ